MQYVEKQEKYAKEVYELMDACKSLAMSIREANKDGWQWGVDLPAVIMSNLGKFNEAVAGMDQLDDEWAADPSAVIKAILGPGSEMVMALLPQKEEETVAQPENPA